MLHQIGNGALGPVFRAYDSERDRLVAIKVFRLDLPPERVHKLVAEFEQLIAAELQHPVIAAPRATGIDAGSNAFLAQDFAAADSLDIVVRENGRAPIANTLRVASQLADALDYVAERQVLHGALHPRDILLSEDDIRIVGVGVGRALERVGVTTPVRRPYSAPERMNDEGWDQRADVFSLAAIVYELLCGRRVAGTGSEAAESLTDVAGCDVEALQRVFALALAADPNYRYATATAFTDALKEAAAPEVDITDPSQASAPKPKVRKPRSKLRVVTPAEGLEVFAPSDVPELTLSDIEPPALTEVEGAPAFEEPSLPLTIFTAEIEEQLAAEPPPKVRLPRRRKVPAPTPVAIETVASSDLLLPDEPVAEPMLIEQVDLLAVPETPLFEAPVIEPAPAYEEPPMFEPQPAFDELAVAHEFAPEPVPAPVFEPVAEPIAEPIPEPRLPAFLEPPAPRSMPTSSHSPVWPIGVAAVIGLAVGFGVGYTIAIRDHAVTTPTAVVASAPVNVAPQPVPTPSVEPPQTKPETPPVAAAPPDQAAVPVFVGRVLVRSTPPGARVFVDGKDRGQTPAAIGDLARGEHRIRILRDGYTAAERRVSLTPSQPTQTLNVPLGREPRARGNAAVEQKPKAPPAPVAETGSLAVETRPEGATVILDGRRVGTTPLNLGDVRAGNHSVQIELNGYRPWSASIALKGGEQNRVTASLEK